MNLERHLSYQMYPGNLQMAILVMSPGWTVVSLRGRCFLRHIHRSRMRTMLCFWINPLNTGLAGHWHIINGILYVHLRISLPPYRSRVLLRCILSITRWISAIFLIIWMNLWKKHIRLRGWNIIVWIAAWRSQSLRRSPGWHYDKYSCLNKGKEI